MDKIYWKDNKYRKFETEYLLKTYTYEEIYDFCRLIKDIEFTEPIDADIMKNDWNKLANNWNREREVEAEDCIVGYMAMVFLLIALPLEKIKNISVFTEEEIKHISLLNLYYNNNKLVTIKGSITKEEISEIKDFDKWLENQIDTSNLILCYLYFKKYYSIDKIENK